MDLRAELDRFYRILNRLERGLGGRRLFSDCSSRSGWPDRGVYFFFHPNERRGTDPTCERVVRVGTHAVSTGSKSTLWRRLAQHRGTRSGGGNHRGSIFRRHCGEAMLASGLHPEPVPTWGQGESAPRDIRLAEGALEKRVSDYLSEHRLIWVMIDDEPSKTSRRSFVERNAIALLSNRLEPLDKVPGQWLGSHSAEDRIRRSGLWNLQHTDALYDYGFLDHFERMVDETIAWSEQNRTARTDTAPPKRGCWVRRDNAVR